MNPSVIIRKILDTISTINMKGWIVIRDRNTRDRTSFPRIAYRVYDFSEDTNIDELDVDSLMLVMELFLDSENEETESTTLLLRNYLESIRDLDCGTWTISTVIVQDCGTIGEFQNGVANSYNRDNIMCKVHLQRS
jgi:hypothetical protein